MVAYYVNRFAFWVFNLSWYPEAISLPTLWERLYSLLHLCVNTVDQRGLT